MKKQGKKNPPTPMPIGPKKPTPPGVITTPGSPSKKPKKPAK